MYEEARASLLGGVYLYKYCREARKSSTNTAFSPHFCETADLKAFSRQAFNLSAKPATVYRA